jgi:hypothetical protein
MKLLSIYIVLIMTTIRTTSADNSNITEYADKFYREWSLQTQIQDVGQPFDAVNFYREVPLPNRPKVLDQILKRSLNTSRSNANTMVIYTALQCVGDLMTGSAKASLDKQLDSDLAVLATSNNYGVRLSVINILGMLKRPKDHDFFVDALNDPKDEVREAAVTAIRSQPDAPTVLRKYITEHRASAEYKTSVLSAQAALETAENKPDSGR